jgi:DnaJ-like protein
VDLISAIAEGRIREAIARGELDDLPSKGKPLRLEDLSRVPEDLRAGYVLLKNAGVLPEEMQLRKETVTLEALLDACRDPEERTRLRRDLNAKLIRYRILIESRRKRGLPSEYRAKVLGRLAR